LDEQSQKPLFAQVTRDAAEELLIEADQKFQ